VVIACLEGSRRERAKTALVIRGSDVVTGKCGNRVFGGGYRVFMVVIGCLEVFFGVFRGGY